MNKWFEIFGGMIIVILTISLAFTFGSWGQAALNLIKGGIVCILILVGILLLIVGISDLKN